jgi:hypothetical protein
MSFAHLRISSVVAALGALLLLVGCNQRPQIETYTVTKDVPDRLLGGILLQDDRGWFFKLTGPRDEIDAVTEQFRDFLKSVRIEPGATQPAWKLPAGWELDSRPREMRVATINVPLKSKPAELTVTVLPRQAGNDAQYLLANINRWRDQMSQGRVATQDIDSLEKIETDGGSVLLVNIAGRQKAGGMMAPFAGGRG